MAFSHTIGGTSFTEASFQGNAYADEATGFPKALEKIVEHVANAYHGTSTDPLTVGAGAKALTITNASGQIPAFAIGMPVRIARTSDPAGVWMQGEVTAWDGVTGIATINVDANKGSGSFSDWSIVIGGHLTTASGASPLAVSQGGTGSSTAAAARDNLEVAFEGAASGILETNSSFIDAVIFGPALDPVDWTSGTVSATAALMLATVETSGSYAEVNIWDLTAELLTEATPLATISLAGTATTPTSIDAAMGFIIIGSSNNGVRFVDPHGGDWAERTDGWPRSMDAVELSHYDVRKVAAGFSDMPLYDPRTGGPMPCFGLTYGTGSNVAALLKDDGGIYNNAGTVGNFGITIAEGRIFASRADSDRVMYSAPISRVTSDGWNQGTLVSTGAVPYTLEGEEVLDIKNGLMAGAQLGGLSFALIHDIAGGSVISNAVAGAKIFQTYNSGWMFGNITGAWLAQDDDADATFEDRSFRGNVLTRSAAGLTIAAVEADAELKGYAGWSNSLYLERAYDPDFELGTGPFHVSLWVKPTNNGQTRTLAMKGTSGDQYGWRVRFAASGKIEFMITDATTNTQITDGVYDENGTWLRIDCVRDDVGDMLIYADGILDIASKVNSTKSINNGSSKFRIGATTSGSANPATACAITLVRHSSTYPSATMVRRMAESEREMFKANAKCLLQSVSTDGVLDVNIDAITGKVAVTQTDSAMIWKGLAIESEPAIASGGTNWQRTKLHGGDRVEINDAGLYATIAAKDLRDELEILRGLKALLPGGVDLSKAKAWIVQSENGTTPGISGSYNIKSLTRSSTGLYVVEFATPFKSDGAYSGGGGNSDVSWVGAASGNNYAIAWIDVSNLASTRHQASIHTRYYDGIAYDSKFMAVFFGELENE
jgi:hypothetical protein